MLYKLILIAIFKNEAHILKEWIEHYLREGVDKIFLIDNGSTDSYHKILEDYIKKNKVSVVIDKTKWAQIELYNKYFLKKCKDAEWVLVADLDEFIYSRNNFKKIIDYLNTIKNNNIGAIKIPWKMFGSNGHIIQPQSVIAGFIKRNIYNNDHDINCKTISRGNLIKKLNQHESIIDSKYLKIQSNNMSDKTKEYFTKINENILKDCNLHLNHYAIQSHNWFNNVKCKRGDVLNPGSENLRNAVYFKNYDTNKKIDKELLEKYKK